MKHWLLALMPYALSLALALLLSFLWFLLAGFLHVPPWLFYMGCGIMGLVCGLVGPDLFR